MHHSARLFFLILTAAWLGSWGCDDSTTSTKKVSNSGGAGGEQEAGGASGQVDERGRAEAAFEILIEETMEDVQIAGLAAAIVDGDRIAWSGGFGWADVEAERRATPDTPFLIASVSKAILGVAMMQAVEDGAVTFETPVNETGIPFTVDNPRIDGESITLRHLATHTSSILDAPAYNCNYFAVEDPWPVWTIADPTLACVEPMITELPEFLEAYLVKGGAYYDAEENFGESRPGEQLSYSNVGASLAGLAVGAATGISLEQYCEERIFGPLGMRNTHWHRSQFSKNNPVAALYHVADGERVRFPDYDSATWPDGGLMASANDLARFVGAVTNGGKWEGVRILREESVHEMLSSQTPELESEFPEGWFYGVFWYSMGHGTGHTGGDAGVSSMMLFEPDAGIAVVILINTSEMSSEIQERLVSGAFEFAESMSD